jgi:hypothetical protein
MIQDQAKMVVYNGRYQNMNMVISIHQNAGQNNNVKTDN